MQTNLCKLTARAQNEFATEGGKLHDAVKGVMANGMLDNAIAACDAARGKGCKVRSRVTRDPCARATCAHTLMNVLAHARRS